MDAAVTTLKFESKAVIPTDPRTKLFLTVTVSTIMITGGTGGFMNFVRPCLMACPIIFFTSFKEMGGRSQICSHIRYDAIVVKCEDGKLVISKAEADERQAITGVSQMVAEGVKKYGN